VLHRAADMPWSRVIPPKAVSRLGYDPPPSRVNLSCVPNWASLSGAQWGCWGCCLRPPLKIGSVSSSRSKRRLLHWLILVDLCVGDWAVFNWSSRDGAGPFAPSAGNELAAHRWVVNTNKCKLAAFIFSEMIAGLAGAFLCPLCIVVSPDTFVLTFNHIMMMAVIGGLGTIWGPIFGAVLITVLPEYLRSYADYR